MTWLPPAWSVLIEPPTEEPITVEEAKLSAGLDWAPETPASAQLEQQMRDFIRASRQQVEADTGLALLTQTRDCYFSTSIDGLLILPTQMLPIQRVVPPDEIPPSLRAARRYVNALAPRNPMVPSLQLEPANITTGVVRVVCGWSDAADLKLQAPLLTHAVSLLTAHRATLGRDLAIAGAVSAISRVPQGYEEAVWAYRLMWVT